MYILTNAVRNVWRHRGRNSQLGAIMLVVVTASVIALMITSTSAAIIAAYADRFSSEVQFRPNMERVREEAMANSTDGMVRMSPPTIEADDYLAYGDSEYLAEAVYVASTGIVLDGVTAVDAELGGGSGMMMVGGPPVTEDAAAETPMSYYGSLQGGAFEEFDDGYRALAAGEFPDELGEVLVSSDLAEINGLAVGDSLTATGQLSDPELGVYETIQYDLTVVGVYDDLTDEYAEGAPQNAFTNSRNEVLASYETVLQNYVSELRGIRLEATFYLADPDLLDAFTEEVRAEGLSDLFDVSTDTASYERIVGPVEGLQSVSWTFLIVVLSFGGVIIVLLSSMAIRERKYEIGVLRAMGMKKLTVGTGLWLEILAVTLVATVVGLGVGALAAQPVTDALLAGQVAAAEAAAAESTGAGGPMLMGPPQTVEGEPLTELSVTLTPASLAQIAGVALALATLAGAFAVSRITKYEPIKILQERN